MATDEKQQPPAPEGHEGLRIVLGKPPETHKPWRELAPDADTGEFVAAGWTVETFAPLPELERYHGEASVRADRAVDKNIEIAGWRDRLAGADAALEVERRRTERLVRAVEALDLSDQETLSAPGSTRISLHRGADLFRELVAAASLNAEDPEPESELYECGEHRGTDAGAGEPCPICTPSPVGEREPKAECSKCGQPDDARRSTCLACGGQMQPVEVEQDERPERGEHDVTCKDCDGDGCDECQHQGVVSTRTADRSDREARIAKVRDRLATLEGSLGLAGDGSEDALQTVAAAAVDALAGDVPSKPSADESLMVGGLVDDIAERVVGKDAWHSMDEEGWERVRRPIREGLALHGVGGVPSQPDDECDCRTAPNREAAMVEAYPGAWCDPCIAPLVKALNECEDLPAVPSRLNPAGIRTLASCCGHGKAPGRISLADGRELLIFPSLEAADAVRAGWASDVPSEPTIAREALSALFGCGFSYDPTTDEWEAPIGEDGQGGFATASQALQAAFKAAVAEGRPSGGEPSAEASEAAARELARRERVDFDSLPGDGKAGNVLLMQECLRVAYRVDAQPEREDGRDLIARLESAEIERDTARAVVERLKGRSASIAAGWADDLAVLQRLRAELGGARRGAEVEAVKRLRASKPLSTDVLRNPSDGLREAVKVAMIRAKGYPVGEDGKPRDAWGKVMTAEDSNAWEKGLRILIAIADALDEHHSPPSLSEQQPDIITDFDRGIDRLPADVSDGLRRRQRQVSRGGSLSERGEDGRRVLEILRCGDMGLEQAISIAASKRQHLPTTVADWLEQYYPELFRPAGGLTVEERRDLHEIARLTLVTRDKRGLLVKPRADELQKAREIAQRLAAVSEGPDEGSG